MEDRLPPNEYLEYYGPDFRLQPPVRKQKPNTNEPEYLEEVSLVPESTAAVGTCMHH